jgi:hypothetical protein
LIKKSNDRKFIHFAIYTSDKLKFIAKDEVEANVTKMATQLTEQNETIQKMNDNIKDIKS